MEDCIVYWQKGLSLILSSKLVVFITVFKLQIFFCKLKDLRRQDNSNVPVVAHQVEDQDTSSEMTVYKYRTVTGLHPLHTPHSNPDVHPKNIHYEKWNKSLITHHALVVQV